MISSIAIFFSKEFFWCTNERQKLPLFAEIIHNLSLQFRVCDVLAVPRQQIVNRVTYCNRDMQTVFCCLGGNYSIYQKGLCKLI